MPEISVEGGKMMVHVDNLTKRYKNPGGGSFDDEIPAGDIRLCRNSAVNHHHAYYAGLLAQPRVRFISMDAYQKALCR